MGLGPVAIWPMGLGPVAMGSGQWDLDLWPWAVANGTWTCDHGQWPMGRGPVAMGHGTWDAPHSFGSRMETPPAREARARSVTPIQRVRLVKICHKCKVRVPRRLWPVHCRSYWHRFNLRRIVCMGFHFVCKIFSFCAKPIVYV